MITFPMRLSNWAFTPASCIWDTLSKTLVKGKVVEQAGRYIDFCTDKVLSKLVKSDRESAYRVEA